MIASNDIDLIKAIEQLHLANLDKKTLHYAKKRADALYWEWVNKTEMDEQKALISSMQSQLADNAAIIADKDAEIQRLKEQLANQSS